MKNIFILTTMLLGSGLMTDTNRVNTAPTQSYKRSSVESGPVGTISILVDKSDYELRVYDDKGWYATYPVVFGNNSLEDKKMEGDKNTPEGTFHIISKRIHDKWDRFLAIDYPTEESWEKFRERKKRGEIPSSARIGGSIGIHGTWPNDDFIIDRYKNWTLGCISMKNVDVEDLYNYVTAGVEVEIRK